MRTKEEILYQYEANREYPTYYHEDNVLRAMDEYAKERAIAFAEWCDDNYIRGSLNDSGESAKWIHGEDIYTTAELYDIFNNENQEKPSNKS